MEIINYIISLIPINIYKELAQLLIGLVPDYFFIIPSSSSGKYHPEDEICEGGLLRHVYKDIKVFIQLCIMHNISDDTFISEGIVALMFHDAFKSGMPQQEHTVFEHPLLAAEFIRNNASGIPAASINNIANAVASHSGRWNTSKYSEIILPTPTTELEKLVHEADFLASRKEFKLDVVIE